nr:sulfite exporter TauE/SafE family protein [uncultured Methanobrevibacter sp.]
MMIMFPIGYFTGLILIGICAGFASGLLGVGGGFLIVPLQYFLLKYIGVEPDLAILISFGTSLAIIVPTSFSGAYRHTRSMDNIVRPGIRLGIFGLIGGAIGGFVASSLPSGVLEIIFGCLLLFIAVKNIIDINKEREEARIPFNLITTAIIGLLVGFSSGLLGVGGGIFLIAILTALLGFSLIEAIGTSSVFICLTAIGGFLSYMVSGWGVSTFPYSIGYVSLINFALIAAFSVPLASVGAKFAHKIPQKKLKIIFSILVFYIALKMLGILP